MNTLDNIKTLGIGSVGFLATEVAPQAVEAVSTDSANFVQVVIQIVIGIATLIGMFKKKK